MRAFRFCTIRFHCVLIITVMLSTIATSARAQLQAPCLREPARVLAFNDLGMHCYDADFSVFSLLPPFNVIHSQVFLKGNKPTILGNTRASVTYSATKDLSGLINTTSEDKTNLWEYMFPLFGVSRPVDTGITGTRMPGFGSMPMNYEGFIKDPIASAAVQSKWFTAAGIPLTDLADWNPAIPPPPGKQFPVNPYPMMKIRANDPRTGAPLSSLDIVLPVSSEMNCASCHQTGMDAAFDGFHGVYDWSNKADTYPVIDYRENILILHDAINNTALMAQYKGSETQPGKPVLCASCHYSKALDLAGTGPQGVQLKHEFLSRAIHLHHGSCQPLAPGGNPFDLSPCPDQSTRPIPEPDSGPSVSTCYFCHPGDETQCLRSVMATSKEKLICQSCHGGLLSVAGPAPLSTTKKIRRPWVDMPKCQSCHTGDAVSNLRNILPPDPYWAPDGIRRTQAYRNPKDPDQVPTASPIIAVNNRFAENADAPYSNKTATLYRNSTAHFGVACEGCHGSTHAEWPSAKILPDGTISDEVNDNRTAIEIQGHKGPIAECTACHSQGLRPSLLGPHGLHNINDSAWMSAHGTFYAADKNSCKACHGIDFKGTVLSKAMANRRFTSQNQNISIAAGNMVNCYLCHPGKTF